MNSKRISRPIIAFAVFLMWTFESEGQPTVDTANSLCENDSGMSLVEENSLRDLVAKLTTEVKGQYRQLNDLWRDTGFHNEQLVYYGGKITELQEVFMESRKRDNLAVRSQLNEIKELTESTQQWNITMVERLVILEQENREQNEQLLFLRQENEFLRTMNTELQQQINGMNSSVEGRTEEVTSLLSEHTEQLRLVQQQNAVHDEQLSLLLQMNSSLVETVAWQQEMRTFLNEMNRTTEERMSALEQENRNREEQLKQTNGSLSRELAQLKEQNSQQRQQLSNAGKHPNDTAIAYIRWGRKVCPPNSTVLYKGYAAGNWFNDQGGGSNYLCLPESPEWGRTIDGVQGGGSYIHGVEYEMQEAHSPFLTTNNGDIQLLNLNAPCSLCQVTGRSTQIMIPARRTCPAGWYLQYRGYLVTSHRSHRKQDYICLDEAPEAIHGSHRNDEGALFYQVEAVCGSLSCPPYVNGGEIACIVCVR